jgi:hypothetical protein
VRGRLIVLLDGRVVGSVERQLNPAPAGGIGRLCRRRVDSVAAGNPAA